MKVVDYSTGGWEHIWDVDAPLEALQELPKSLFCSSAWAEYPSAIGGAVHPSWDTPFDDEKERG